MRHTVTVKIDTSAVEEALSNLAEGGDYSGMDVDGTSEYEVTDVLTEQKDETTWEVTVEVERYAGKFAPKDEFIDRVVAAFEDVVEVSLEVE